MQGRKQCFSQCQRLHCENSSGLWCSVAHWLQQWRLDASGGPALGCSVLVSFSSATVSHSSVLCACMRFQRCNLIAKGRGRQSSDNWGLEVEGLQTTQCNAACDSEVMRSSCHQNCGESNALVYWLIFVIISAFSCSFVKFACAYWNYLRISDHARK